jgi:CDP-diacylglycerol--serine O-phosphatidyltransferase
MVSFGVAPAIVTYQWGVARIAEYGPLWRRLGWLVCFFYAAAAALRLARFNSRAATQDKHYFEGLPSPSAAAIVAALVWLASDQTNIGLPGLIFAFLVTAFAGALMISRFAFNSFKQVNPGARVRFTHIVFVPLTFIFIFLYPAITLVLLFGCYALSAPLLWAYRKLRRRSRSASAPHT